MNEKTRNKINERSLFVNASTKVKEARNITYMSNLYQFDCLKWFLKGRKNTMGNIPKDVISFNPVVKLTSLFWKHYNSMETPLIPPLLINVSLHQASGKKNKLFQWLLCIAMSYSRATSWCNKSFKCQGLTLTIKKFLK